MSNLVPAVPIPFAPLVAPPVLLPQPHFAPPITDANNYTTANTHTTDVDPFAGDCAALLALDDPLVDEVPALVVNRTADAGASTIIPMAAGQIKKGGYMMIKGHPCKVLSISVSKTGKHGHAKCNFVGTDIFTGKKYEDTVPPTNVTAVPIVNRTEWELIDIDGDECMLMDEAGNQKNNLNLPQYPRGLSDEIRHAWNGGMSSVIVSVLAAVNVEQIIAYRKESNSGS